MFKNIFIALFALALMAMVPFSAEADSDIVNGVDTGVSGNDEGSGVRDNVGFDLTTDEGRNGWDAHLDGANDSGATGYKGRGRGVTGPGCPRPGNNMDLPCIIQ